MLDFLDTLLQPYIDTNKPIYVAYSGGLDSTVLLHLAAQLNIDILAIHANHNLSPNAQNWQLHCQQTCAELNIPFITKSVTLTKDGSGLEAEARKLRYGAIAEAIEPESVVLTGQHQDDQLETFLLQLKRGAGPKGLSSMPQSAVFAKEALLLRPLLNFSRAALEAYAKAHHLSWIEDESNCDTQFDRNFIRHQVTPVLAERWPGFAKAATRSIALIAEQQQLLDELSQEDLSALLKADNQLDISRLLKLSKPRQRNAVRYWIDRLGITMPSQVILGRIFSEVIGAKVDGNPQVQWAGHQLRRYRDHLYLLRDVQTKPGVDCELKLNQPLTLNAGIGTICLTDDIAAQGLKVPTPLSNEEVCIRFGVQGLSFKPLGSKHTRKVKDLFKEQGVPPWERARTPMLFYGERLIAIGRLVSGSLSTHQGELSLIYHF